MGRVLTALLLALAALPATPASAGASPQEVIRSGDDPASRDALSDLLENIRRVIREGSEDPYIPVLDPLQLESQDLNFSEDRAYEVKGGLRNVLSTGLGDFVSTMSTEYIVLLSRLIVTVDITVPLLNAQGQYSLDALLGEVVHLYGNGNFRMDLEEFNVTIVAEISLGITSSKLRRLTTVLNIGDFKFTVDGLLDGGLVDGIFNLAVNEIAKVIFENQKPVLEDYLASLLEDPLNEVLKDFGMRDLLCLIGLCGSGRGDNGNLESSNNIQSANSDVVSDTGNKNGSTYVDHGNKGAGVRDRLVKHISN